VEPNSTDFEKAKKELEELEAKIPKPEETLPVGEETEESQLQEVSPLPTPQLSPIELPVEEAAPEIPTDLQGETILPEETSPTTIPESSTTASPTASLGE